MVRNTGYNSGKMIDKICSTLHTVNEGKHSDTQKVNFEFGAVVS